MLSSRIKIDYSNVSCSNNHLGQKILQVIVDQECKGTQKFLCSECIENLRGVQHVMSFVEASSAIEELKNKQIQQTQDAVQPFIRIIEKYMDQINKLKSKFFSYFESLEENAKEWKKQLNNLILQNNNCDFIQEVDNLSYSFIAILNEQQVIDTKNINSINYIYKKKIKLIVSKLQTEMIQWDLFSCDDENFQKISIQEAIVDEKEDYVWKKVQEIKQQQSCWAIAFNSQNSIMVAGLEEKIKVWNFKNQQLVDSEVILEGHIDYVQCISFSKKKNWFVSSGLDEKIICWNLNNLNSWQRKIFDNTDQGTIQCLMLTPKEDQLISSHDSKIKLWSVDIQSNSISFLQQLEMHQQTIQSISINWDQSFMISSSSDNKIIVWQNQDKNFWSFKSIINKTAKDYGIRISFISNNTFSCLHEKQGTVDIFNFENGHFVEKPELKVQLESENVSNRCKLFPSIFNVATQTLIKKLNKFVYILKCESGNILKIYGDPINCYSQFNYGSMTNDGKYLVVWNSETKSFNLYKLNL